MLGACLLGTESARTCAASIRFGVGVAELVVDEALICQETGDEKGNFRTFHKLLIFCLHSVALVTRKRFAMLAWIAVELFRSFSAAVCFWMVVLGTAGW